MTATGAAAGGSCPDITGAYGGSVINTATGFFVGASVTATGLSEGIPRVIAVGDGVGIGVCVVASVVGDGDSAMTGASVGFGVSFVSPPAIIKSPGCNQPSPGVGLGGAAFILTAVVGPDDGDADDSIMLGVMLGTDDSASSGVGNRDGSGERLGPSVGTPVPNGSPVSVSM